MTAASRTKRASAVTNKNKKRPSGYRAPASDEGSRPARKGILDSLFSPRVRHHVIHAQGADVAAARYRDRGHVTGHRGHAPSWSWWWNGSSWSRSAPRGRSRSWSNQLGVPPVGSYTDLTLAIGVFGVQTGFLALLGFLVVRAVVLAMLDGPGDRRAADGSASRSVVHESGSGSLPMALIVNIACLGLLVVANFIGPCWARDSDLLSCWPRSWAGSTCWSSRSTIAGDGAARCGRDHEPLGASRSACPAPATSCSRPSTCSPRWPCSWRPSRSPDRA